MINGMNETNLSMPLGQFSDTYQRSLNTSLSQTNLIITPERPTQVVQTKVKGVSQLQCLKQCLLSLQLARRHPPYNTQGSMTERLKPDQSEYDTGSVMT